MNASERIIGRGNAEEKEEIEMSLGLSIGGGLRKPKEAKDAEMRALEASRKGTKSLSRSVVDAEGSWESMDQQRKREIQALRRQDEMKKSEGNPKRGICRKWMENEEYAAVVESLRKRSKDCIIEEEIGRNKEGDEAVNLNQSSKPSLAVPIVPVPYAYPQLQYIQFHYGFPYPLVVPYWSPIPTLSLENENNEKKEKNIFRPEACRSFQPYRRNLTNGIDSNEDSNSSKGGAEKWKYFFDASSATSSSSHWDCRITSVNGRNRSNDSENHASQSIYSQQEEDKLNASSASSVSEQSETSSSSKQIKSDQAMENIPVIDYSQPDPDTKPNSKSSPLKNNVLQQMPCVSTTGNGPDGKTIIGLLYKYTKTEVKIVCVCHGSSFSPAEFVEHAGGINVEHPSRHITVISSAF